MGTPSAVVVLTGEAGTGDAVARALGADRGLSIEASCADMHELAAHLDRTGAAVAIVDVDPAPERTLSALEPLISRFSATRFVVLSSSAEPGNLLEAMRVGARHLVAKHTIATSLAPVLHRLIPNGKPGTTAHGCAVSVIPAGGGCGATLLAANLAHELADITSTQTLLVDMDCFYPSVPVLLGIEARYTLADVLSSGERLDGELIKSAAAPGGGSLSVLTSPAGGYLTPERLDAQHLGRFFSACKETYAFSVVDAPRLPMAVAGRVAAASAATFVPFQLTVQGVRAARAIIDGLTRAGCAPERLLPLVTRYVRRRAPVPLPDAARALGRPTLETLANDYGAAVESVNLGRPLATVVPRSALRKEIRSLAERIHTHHTQGAPLTR